MWDVCHLMPKLSPWSKGRVRSGQGQVLEMTTELIMSGHNARIRVVGRCAFKVNQTGYPTDSAQSWINALCLTYMGSLNTILWWPLWTPCSWPGRGEVSEKKWAKTSTFISWVYQWLICRGGDGGLLRECWMNKWEAIRRLGFYSLGHLCVSSNGYFYCFSPTLNTTISNNEIYCIIYVIVK